MPTKSYVKLVVAGDAGVGKTCLLITTTQGLFPSGYVPPEHAAYVIEMMVDGEVYCVGLWDIIGDDRYIPLRHLNYPQTDVLFICFDISNVNSFKNIETVWAPEFDHHCNDAPRILIGCKSDLRGSGTASGERCVSYEEGKKMAAKLKFSLYLETSALQADGTGVKLFELAVRVGAAGWKANRKIKKGCGPPQILLPPAMPVTGLAPEIEIETCTIGEQWLDLFHQGSCVDTTLVLSSGTEIKSHKTILCGASEVFMKAFGIDCKKSVGESCMKAEMQKTEFNHPAISKVETDGVNLSRIYLTERVDPDALKHALEFFYSGRVKFGNNPSTDLLVTIREFSDMFDIPYLKQICDNVENKEEDLNPGIGARVCELNSQNMGTLFLNQQLYADVMFTFGDKTVYGHKAILSARNETMAAMLDGRFLEKSTVDMSKNSELTIETFLLMLEYLYTGNVALDCENVDLAALLMLSDQYNITRLTNLCELHLTKRVNRKVPVETSDIDDVIGLLNISKMHNAPQLGRWCRFFISSNYLQFSSISEWNQLNSEDLKQIEELSQSQVRYQNELTEYEMRVAQRERKSTKEGCSCVVM